MVRSVINRWIFWFVGRLMGRLLVYRLAITDLLEALSSPSNQVLQTT